jgi:hypothetical protein
VGRLCVLEHVDATSFCVSGRHSQGLDVDVRQNTNWVESQLTWRYSAA